MSGFLPVMNGPEMEEKANEYLKLHRIQDIYPGYDPVTTVVEAERQRVHLAVWMKKMKKDDVEGTGVKEETFLLLGQLAARCSWQLQEGRRVGSGKMMQNHFCYTHHQSPPSDELLHVIGEAITTPTGVHNLSFDLHTFDHRQRKVPVGSGTSTLKVVESPAPPPQEPRRAAELPRFLRSPSSSESSDPTTPFSAPNRSFAAAPPAIRSPMSSEASTLPPSTPAKRQLATDTSPPPSTPTKRRQPPSEFSTPSTTGYTPRREHLPPPRVFWPIGCNTLKSIDEAEFMYVNVGSVRPSTDKTVAKILEEYGIVPKDVRFENLPIRARDRYVFFFKANNEDERCQLEKIMQKERWSEKFDAAKMCEEASTPFLYYSLPVVEIVEACFLSTLGLDERDASVSLNHLLNLKHNIKKVVQKKDVVERICKLLNKTGRNLFKFEIQPYAGQSCHISCHGKNGHVTTTSIDHSCSQTMGNMAANQNVTKKKAVIGGIFKAELNNFLMKELAEDGRSGNSS